jgi:hypothetical protein
MRHEIVQEVGKMRLLLITGRRVTLYALATALLVVAGGVFAASAVAQGGSGSDLTGTIVFQTVSGGPIYAVKADSLASVGGTPCVT